MQPVLPLMAQLLCLRDRLGPRLHAGISSQSCEIFSVGQLLSRQGGHPSGIGRQQHHVVQPMRGTVTPLPGLVKPTGHHTSLKVRVEHQAGLHCGVMPVEVVIHQATVPVRSGHRTRNVAHGLEHEGNRSRCQHDRNEVADIELHPPGRQITQGYRQTLTGAGKHRPLQKQTHSLARHSIA